ncbi:hypothetical protein TNCV_4110421 [Trichonephila clavipes]|nr:hypothetical protein TNCV_4110421 [Trichonephila clavipes]
MSRQRDLPESMTWCIIVSLKSGQTKRTVPNAVEVIATPCNRFQETGLVEVGQDKVAYVLTQQIMTNTSC